MNDAVDELRRENEELRVATVAKQLDLDNLKKQLTEGSATPLMFAKDSTREEFWKVMTRIQAEQAALQEKRLQLQTETYTYKAKTELQEVEIKDLREQVKKLDALQEEKLKLYENLNTMVDEKTENEHFIREMMIRMRGETERVKLLEKDKEELTEFALNLKS